jgi:hypothetical protein
LPIKKLRLSQHWQTFMLTNPFKKNDKIVFWTENEILKNIYPIVPAYKLMPDWFKSLDTHVVGQNKIKASTVKRCPGIIKYLAQGYIIRSWCDVVITTDVKHNNVNYRYTDTDPTTGRTDVFKYVGVGHPISMMSPIAFGTPSALPNNYLQNVLKWALGWHAWMPKGYDLWYAPPQYHFNPNFTTCTGILDTRITEQLNVQMFWHPTEETVVIPAGTPLAQIIPIKREKLDFEIEYDKDKFHTNRLKEKFTKYWFKFSDKLNFMNYKYFNDEIDDNKREIYREKK